MPKELSRKAVLEQQEENKIQMGKLLEDQRKKFQEFLQEQVKTSFFNASSKSVTIISTHLITCASHELLAFSLLTFGLSEKMAFGNAS